MFDDITIDELLDMQLNDLSARIGNSTHESSSWSVHSILQHQLFISEITRCEESSYFLSVNGLTNIRNDDGDYFRRCLIRYLNPAHKNPAII